ncbi:hypothetical protein HK096_001394 [Nowakowskiella sp. JEL0078]|nr:hypothetical protein HK096_001394 [Nowakowskiella sp. JEL0078]
MNLIFVSSFRALEGTIVGAIGAIFMLVLGLGFKAELPELLDAPNFPSDPKSFAGSCFIAGFLYFLIFGFCFCQVRMHNSNMFSPTPSSFFGGDGDSGGGGFEREEERIYMGDLNEFNSKLDEHYVPILRRQGGWRPVYMQRNNIFGGNVSNSRSTCDSKRGIHKEGPKIAQGESSLRVSTSTAVRRGNFGKAVELEPAESVSNTPSPSMSPVTRINAVVTSMVRSVSFGSATSNGKKLL